MKLQTSLLAAAILLGSAPAAPARAEVAGTFQGTYTCMQGLTAATLRIEEVKGDMLQARFSFGPTPENPSVPRGSFLMEGRIDRMSGVMALAPTFWVEQPKGFNMIGLIGWTGPALSTFEGSVLDGAACTTFRLSRLVG